MLHFPWPPLAPGRYNDLGPITEITFEIADVVFIVKPSHTGMRPWGMRYRVTCLTCICAGRGGHGDPNGRDALNPPAVIAEHLRHYHAWDKPHDHEEHWTWAQTEAGVRRLRDGTVVVDVPASTPTAPVEMLTCSCKRTADGRGIYPSGACPVHRYSHGGGMAGHDNDDDDDHASGSGDFSIGSTCWPGIAKLLEESGEVSQVCGKLIGARGVPEHWDGTNLKTCLEDEIADQQAAIAFVLKHNHLDTTRMAARTAAKLQRFETWHTRSDGNDVEAQRCPVCNGLVADAGCKRCAKAPRP